MTERFEQVAVVADDDDGVRILAQIDFEPGSAFEIEIVGRLVEHQQLGLREQHAAERCAHAPAAGEFLAGAREVVLREAEADEDFGRARFARPRIDVGEALVDLADAIGVFAGVGLAHQAGAFDVGLEHDIEQRSVVGRDFLQHVAHLRAALDADGAVALPSPLASSSRMMRSRVDLPVPLRPTRPTFQPSAIWAEAPSNRGRPSIRKVRSEICSMASGGRGALFWGGFCGPV